MNDNDWTQDAEKAEYDPYFRTLTVYWVYGGSQQYMGAQAEVAMNDLLAANVEVHEFKQSPLY